MDEVAAACVRQWGLWIQGGLSGTGSPGSLRSLEVMSFLLGLIMQLGTVSQKSIAVCSAFYTLPPL